MRIQILYASRRCPYRFTAQEGNIPSPSEIETQYVKVADYEVVEDCVTPDDIFSIMNLEPETCFDRTAYDRGVEHTSMSVGDIVMLDSEAHLCLPVGWHKLN